MDASGSSAPASPDLNDRDRSGSLGREESVIRAIFGEIQDTEESEIDIIFGGAGETEEDEEDEEDDEDDEDEIREDDLAEYGKLHHIAAWSVGAACDNIC